MTEPRIEALENLATQHSQEIRRMYEAFGEIRDTMQAFVTVITEPTTQINQNTLNLAQLTTDIAELKAAVVLQSENFRSVSESVERVNNTVEILANQAAIDREVWQAEIRQIWEYLIRQSGNGHSN